METKSSEHNEPEPAMPAGFAKVPLGENEFVIHHSRAGMGCMNSFLIVLLTGWSFACIILLWRYLRGEKMEGDGGVEGGTPIPFWFVLCFWVGEIILAFSLTYLLFCKKSFRTDAASLHVDTDVLGFRRTKTISRAAIMRFIQIKDGGDGDDSFPSWGLKVEADKKITLLFRQPHDQSLWLGRTLAKWARVEFIEAPRA